jgi:hypothetical protein
VIVKRITFSIAEWIIPDVGELTRPTFLEEPSFNPTKWYEITCVTT